MMSKQITVVALRWCPMGGIGSRRWSKFAKYLSREGLTIDVVTAEYPRKDVVNWCHDVAGNARITARRYPLGYPAWLLRPKRDFWIKLGSHFLARTTHRNDVAERWVRGLIKRSTEIFPTEGTVVLTVPPFSLLELVPALRKSHPQLRLILDYRDPWNAPVSTREAAALVAADAVWVTTREHADHLQRTYTTPEEKLTVVPNGFDPEDYRNVVTTQPAKGYAVYAGSISTQRLAQLLLLLRRLDASPHPALKETFQLAIYSNSAVPVRSLTETDRQLVERYVTVHPAVSGAAMPAILTQYRYGLTIASPGADKIIPVKNLEYLATGRTIISLGPVTGFLQELEREGHFVATYEEAELDRLLGKLAAVVESPSASAKADSRVRAAYDLSLIAAAVRERLRS